MTLKSISGDSGLKELGINTLTGEACAYSTRILCDLNEDGVTLFKAYLGLTAEAALAAPWNSSPINGKPPVASVMIDREMFEPLARFALFTQGFQFVYGRKGGGNIYYTAYNQVDIDCNSGVRDMHSLARSGVGDAYVWVNPAAFNNAQPRVGSRNVHAATGRTE